MASPVAEMKPSQVEKQTWKRSLDRWSAEETSVLIKAWAPLYNKYSRRCRRGTVRGHARSSLTEHEWRDVASAVNSCRTTAAGLGSCRTRSQCKRRAAYLRSMYVKGQAARLGWPFLGALHEVLAGEAGDHGAGAGAAVEGRGAGAPAGDVERERTTAAQALAAAVVDAALLTKMAEIYKELRMFDFGREQTAAAHAGAGGGRA